MDGLGIRDYERALALGETCGDTIGEGRWRAVCNLAPDHDLPHEQWRGCGTVTFRTWPFTPKEEPR
ncbi:hypothetical protein [Micromonospora sp. NPDC023956]|uniref:hypothetical protein n=1 Tax=Micromonospora sp. NPDC023956 TaxID=3155722 RepID=UPI0033ECE2E0